MFVRFPRTDEVSKQRGKTVAANKIAKAIAGGATALSTGLVAAAAEGGVTTVELVVTACGVIVAAALVWAVPNKDGAQ
jgi:sugar phosphate permease